MTHSWGFTNSIGHAYIISADLGSINDATAISIIERYGEIKRWGGTWSEDPSWRFTEYRLLNAFRMMGRPYGEIIDRIAGLLKEPTLKNAHIVLDATGVGRAVVDLVKDRLRASKLPTGRLRAISITGGDAVHEDIINGVKQFNVPKRDLVGALQVVFQNGELKIPDSLDLKDELIKECQNFRVKISADTGHTSYEHWRSTDHDDLVLSVAMGVWYFEHRRVSTTFGMGRG